MSQQGLQLLTQWEGYRRTVYDDVGGKATIGVGHLLTAAELSSGTITIDGQAVSWADGLSDAQVISLLAQDVAVYERAVVADVTVPLAQHQFDALVSFTFNEGIGSLAKSTLLKDVNAGDDADVAAQFMRWTKVGTTVSQGLVNRRRNEVKLWNGEFGDDGAAPPGPAPADPTASGDPSSQAGGSTYAVQPGDTIASVAAKFGLSQADFAHLNNLINPADFAPGKVFRVR